MAKAERPLFYIGGGVVNSGAAASQLLTEFDAPDRLPLHPDA